MLLSVRVIEGGAGWAGVKQACGLEAATAAALWLRARDLEHQKHQLHAWQLLFPLLWTSDSSHGVAAVAAACPHTLLLLEGRGENEEK